MLTILLACCRFYRSLLLPLHFTFCVQKASRVTWHILSTNSADFSSAFSARFTSLSSRHGSCRSCPMLLFEDSSAANCWPLASYVKPSLESQKRSCPMLLFEDSSAANCWPLASYVKPSLSSKLSSLWSSVSFLLSLISPFL